MASGIVLLLASLFSFISALIALGFLSMGAWISSTPFVLATVFGIYFIYLQWPSSEPEEAEPVDIVKKIQKIQEKAIQDRIDKITTKKVEAEDE